MATQQGAPSRPWFRLATMVRPPPPAAPPAPTPQPDQAPPPPPPRPAAFMRPAFSQTFRAPPSVPPPQTTATPPAVSPPRPTTTLPAANGVAPTSPPQPPAARASPPPSSPKETSSSTSRTSPMQQSRPPSPVPPPPPPPPPQPSYSPPPIPRSSTPIYSPPKSGKTLEKNSPPSPPIHSVSHPPSPLALPSPQLKPEYEQKTMVVQETKEIPKNVDNGFNGDIRRHSGNWGTRNPKKPETSKKHSHSDSEDGGMRIITIAGENKGAIMELSPFGKKTHNFGDNPHRLHMKKDTQPSDGEKSGINSEGKSKAMKSKSPVMSAVMNSNVQGVNNSILYNCSTSHHDPGVHLSLSRKPMGFNSKIKDHIN